jgi:hypothetical protein
MNNKVNPLADRFPPEDNELEGDINLNESDFAKTEKTGLLPP